MEGGEEKNRPSVHTRTRQNYCAPLMDCLFVLLLFFFGWGGSRGKPPRKHAQRRFFDFMPASLDMAREMVMSHEIDIEMARGIETVREIATTTATIQL